MARFTNLRISLQEWSPHVVQRWWNMVITPLTFVPLLAGVIAFIVWARNVQPPLPIWNLVLIIGGALLFLIVSFFAFHRVRVERDQARATIGKQKQELSEKVRPKNDLKIRARVSRITTYDYYARAEARGDAEGDKNIEVQVFLSPLNPMTLDTLALEFGGTRFYAKELPNRVLTVPNSYLLNFDIPKRQSIDTKEACIYVLAGNLEWWSEPFAINFGGQ